MELRNVTRGVALATDAEVADSPWAQFRGLMGRKSLPAGGALLLPGTRGVHTHFMRFPIDVLFYDSALRVLHVSHALHPWRLSPYKWRAAGAIELPAGVAAISHTVVGDVLSLT